MKTIITWTLLYLLFCIPRFSYTAESAAEPELFDLSLEELMEVEIFSATKTETSIARIPSKVIVVTREDIRRRNYRYLWDVIQDLPGVHGYRRVQTEFGMETLVRGVFNNNKLLILWNGQRINAPANKPYHFGNQISLANVKKVEFIYGPASALYGADAVNGVVNIVTDSYEDLKDQGNNHVDIGFGIDNTYEANGQTAIKYGNLTGSLFAAYRRSDGPNFLDDHPNFYAGLNSAEYRAQGGKPGFEAPEESFEFQTKINLNESTRIHLLHTDDSASSAWSFGVPVFEFSKENIWRERQTNIDLQNETEVKENLQLRSQISYSRRDVNPDSQFINAFFNNFESFTREDYKYERGVRYAITEELAWTHEKLQLVSGMTYEDIDSTPKLSVVTGQRADPDIPLSYQTNPNIPIAEVSFRKYGVYSQAQYALSDQINLLAGVRWDKVWDYDGFVSPRVGITWSPNKMLDFRASYATATLTPSPYFRFENFNNAAFPGENTIGALPNSDLENEEYETYELGVTATLQENVYVDASVFYNQVDNYMLHQRQANLPFTFVPAIGNTPARTVTDAVSVLLNENGGEMETYGVDTSIRIKHGKSTDTWLYYSYLDGEQEETSTLAASAPGKFDLALISNHTVKGGLTYSFKQNRFSITPYFTWTGNLTTRPDNSTYQGRDADGYFVLNLAVNYETDRYRIWTLARNLNDEKYATPSGTGGSNNAPEQPQDRFGWYAGATVFF